MSVQAFSDSILKTLDKISASCKDRHAYLKTCCAFVAAELRKDSSLDALTPEERANMLFYPLKIAAESREEVFVAPAIDSIQSFLSHGLVDSSFVYKSPDVPLPPKKKGFSLFSGSETPPSQTPKNEKEENVALVQVLLGVVCMNASLASENTQLLVVRALLTAVSTSRCNVHGSSLLLCIRTTCDVFLQAKVTPAQTSAKAALSQMIGTVQLRLESEDPSNSTSALQRSLEAAEEMDDASSTTASDTADSADKADEGLAFTSANERDCFLLLRSLCKLSSKPCDASLPPDSVEMKSKILSLQLIYNLVSNMGPVFASRPSCSKAIHKYLCVSLVHNFTSASAEVTKISANILLQLLLEHRAKMNTKIPIFFTNVLFPILESPNGSFEHRNAVLTLLEKFLSDGQAAADMFVNFDCALGTPNLYQTLIYRVSRVVQSSHVVPNWISPAQDATLKLHAVKAISSHVSALRQWTVQQQQQQRIADEAAAGNTSVPREDDDSGSSGALSAASKSGNPEFERMLKGKKTFEAVLEVFNKKKPKEGIALAVEVGLIKDETAAEIAQFLLTKGLDKLKIGEYLSQNNAFVKEVLKAFIENNDFTGLEIDEAMRVFLGKFKIFGEAEVVDRTMELFAEKYCSENPDAFSSAGTAYILAFSIMMLNTDAHSVHVKSKMTLQEFIRNNRGIDDGRDLPEELMQAVYTRITTKEIKLEGEGSGTAPSEASSPTKMASASSHADPNSRKNDLNDIFTSLEKKKQMSYKTETEQLMQQSMQLLTADAHSDDTEFTSATGAEVAGAMWEAAWTPILPALSVPMEESEDEAMIDCCLIGFDCGMSLNCTFSLSTERKAFISSLLAFTHLTSFREIHYKNVKSITTLIQIAAREGNALEGSWYEILRCISWLDKLHLLSGHTKNDSVLRMSESSGAPSRRDTGVSQKAAEQKRMELLNAEVIASNINQVDVDRVFSKSGELEGRAVVDLVEALCKVSAEELSELPRPRTYSLQKLVEVAEINVGRLRYVWSQMWQHLSKHFISVGLDKQQLVAMFVVDSLRQLAMKFLQRDELGNFNFQRDFLKPFEVIASHNKRPEIHELVIASLGQMVDARARNIMSGWKIVLNTLGRCAGDPHRSVVVAASEVLERITIKQAHLLATPELLTEATNTWSMFGANTVDGPLSLRSIRFIKLIAVFAARGVPPSVIDMIALHQQETGNTDGGDDNAVEGSARGSAHLPAVESILAVLEGDEHFYANHGVQPISIRCTDPSSGAAGSYDIKLWLTIFAALSSLSGVADMDTRATAVESLFHVIRCHGGHFHLADWQMILGGTVYPIFENLLCDLSQLAEEAANGGNQLASAQHEAQLRLLMYAMRQSVTLMVTYHDLIAPSIKDLLDAFVTCSRRSSDVAVVRLGFSMVQELIQALSAKGVADDATWDLVDQRLTAFSDDLCRKVVDAIQRPVSAADDSASVSQLTALRELCVAVGAVLNTVTAPAAVVCHFSQILRTVFGVCCNVLDAGDATPGAELDGEVRRSVVDAEEAACDGYIYIAAQLPSTEEKALFYQTARVMLMRVQSWPSDAMHSAAVNAECTMMASVAVAVMNSAVDLADDEFEEFLSQCYPAVVDLIPLCHPEINKAAAALLHRARPSR